MFSSSIGSPDDVPDESEMSPASRLKEIWQRKQINVLGQRLISQCAEAHRETIRLATDIRESQKQEEERKHRETMEFNETLLEM